MPTITDQTEGGEIIDIYKIYHVKNVVSYSLCGNTYNRWNIETATDSTEASHMYFIIDTFYHEAFSHWVFESGVYLDLFNRLRKLYPIKLVLKARRTYKSLFCELFNIHEDDIVYDIQPGNICIFPSPISAMNDLTISDQYTKQLIRLYDSFAPYRNGPKSIDILLLPRQVKENYKGNDRTYCVDRLLAYLSEYRGSYAVLHTDSITDIFDQISQVSRAKKLIVTDGSPFLVNAMFIENARIYVLGVDSRWHQETQPKVAKIIELSKNTYARYENEADLLKDIQQ